jgi:hypothetical protein
MELRKLHRDPARAAEDLDNHCWAPVRRTALLAVASFALDPRGAFDIRDNTSSQQPGGLAE